jgi:hypothetical protein
MYAGLREKPNLKDKPILRSPVRKQSSGAPEIARQPSTLNKGPFKFEDLLKMDARLIKEFRPADLLD